MEEEAEALGADGIVGVRLTVNLAIDPQRAAVGAVPRRGRSGRKQRRLPPPLAQASPTAAGCRAGSSSPTQQWRAWCAADGLGAVPLAAVGAAARRRRRYSLGAQHRRVHRDRHGGAASRRRRAFKNKHGKPFQSDLSGQDFWMLVRTRLSARRLRDGQLRLLRAAAACSQAPATAERASSPQYTHALYDARELAIERLQDEAEALGATGIVGVTVAEQQHSWRANAVERRQRRAADRRGDRAVRDRHRGRADRRGAASSASRRSCCRRTTSRAPAKRSAPNDALRSSASSSVTEFLTLARVGFLPRGLVIGSCVFAAGTQYDWTVATARDPARSAKAMRRRAHDRDRSGMRDAGASQLGAEGVVDVRLEVEHHLWRGARQVAKFIAVGTAVDVRSRSRARRAARRAEPAARGRRAVRRATCRARDFVTLLARGLSAGHASRWATASTGSIRASCARYRGHDAEIAGTRRRSSTRARRAMERLQDDLFREWPRGHPDAPDRHRRHDRERVGLRRRRRVGPADRRVHRARHRDRAARPERSAPAPRPAATQARRPARPLTFTAWCCRNSRRAEPVSIYASSLGSEQL